MLWPAKRDPIIIALFILASCGKSTGQSNQVSSPIKINLTDVSQLLVAPSGLSRKPLELSNPNETTNSESKLNDVYALNKANDISPIKIADLISGSSNHQATSNLAIDSNAFVLFRFDGLYQRPNQSPSPRQCVLVGVRKSDGSLACIKSNPRCDSQNTCNIDSYKSQIKSNPSGDTLFVVLGDGGLSKIDLKDPTNPIESAIFTHATLGDASMPIVNGNNDVMTQVNLANQEKSVTTKIFSASGLSYTLPGSDQTNIISCAFSGANTFASNFYYIALDSPSNVFSYIQLSRGEDGSFSPTTLYQEKVGTGVLGANCTQIVHNGERIFGLNWYNALNPTFPGNSVLMEYPTSAGSIQHYQLDSQFPIKTDIKSHNGGLVIIGTTADGLKSGIERFDLASNRAMTILPADRYQITSISVSANGDISFIGRRLSDQVNFVGRIPLNSVTTNETDLNQPAISIVTLQ